MFTFFYIHKGGTLSHFISFYLLYIDAQMIAEQVIGSLMTFEDLGDGLNARGFSWLCVQTRDVLFLEPNEVGGVAKWKVPLTCT